jgi:hypothetical protein
MQNAVRHPACKSKSPAPWRLSRHSRSLISPAKCAFAAKEKEDYELAVATVETTAEDAERLAGSCIFWAIRSATPILPRQGSAAVAPRGSGWASAGRKATLSRFQLIVDEARRLVTDELSSRAP